MFFDFFVLNMIFPKVKNPKKSWRPNSVSPHPGRGTLWYLMVPYGTIWYLMVPYGTIWYHMVPYGTIWNLMVPKGTLWYHVVPYGTLRYHFPIFQFSIFDFSFSIFNFPFSHCFYLFMFFQVVPVFVFPDFL